MKPTITKTQGNKLFSDTAFKDLVSKSKSDLEGLALDLKSDLTPLEETVAIKKLILLLENRLEFKKKDTKEEFLNESGGATRNTVYGFDIQLKRMKNYRFSDEVEAKVEIQKDLGKEITALKNLEKVNGTAKLIKEDTLLSFKML